jgi:hypothetical protein
MNSDYRRVKCAVPKDRNEFLLNREDFIKWSKRDGKPNEEINQALVESGMPAMTEAETRNESKDLSVP